MSGNGNSPPGTDSVYEFAEHLVRGILDNNQALEADISPSGELYRAIERFHRTAGTLPLSRRATEAMSSETNPDTQQEPSESSPLFILPPPPPRTEQTRWERPPRAPQRMSAVREQRPRLGASDRYMERHRARMEGANSSGPISDLHHAGRQLEAASSNLRAILDDPIPNFSSPLLEAQDLSPEAEHNRRAKRRKLDNDKSEAGFKGFSYGRYGQNEPGKLKMEIVSCDGGIFEEHLGRDYAAENVLENDATVYCTKSNRCNLILRHQGSTIFSLKELIIKAPHSGYTAPVQEGMVFISMTLDDLLTRTAQYQIQYSPAPSRRPAQERSNELPPIMSIRHNSDGSSSMTAAQVRARRLYDIGLQDEDCDFRTAQIPPDFITNAPSFQVTTECSDSEGGDEETDQGPVTRTRPLHRLIGVPFDSDSSDDEQVPNLEPASNVYRSWHGQAGGSNGRRRRRRGTASNITVNEGLIAAAEASQAATQEAVRAVGGELMAPHARFFIERDKSKCTIRFEPPVSGRFILLKMWSPHQSPTGNIDIQSVVARGFAGPRFFPAIQMR